jgi:xanthine dehydrogenase accessory factor
MVSRTLAAIDRLVGSERLGATATIVEGPDIGAKVVIDVDDGIIAGQLPDDVVDVVLADAVSLMQGEQSRTLAYGDRRIYIESLAPPPVLLVFGAGHVSQPLARMAQMVGFRVIVADARKTWATEERFPDVDDLVVDWPDQVFELYVPDRRTYVVITSHDARFEDPVFPALHRAPIRYLGAMGSRRTHRARLERLAAAGWSEDELQTIHGPIGLDIGAETPDETAVSILAEIIQVRYGHGTGLSLHGTEGRIHAQRGEEEGTA